MKSCDLQWCTSLLIVRRGICFILEKQLHYCIIEFTSGVVYACIPRQDLGPDLSSVLQS
jgi:hypothetical protein